MKRHRFITSERDWPTGHMAWSFGSPEEFEAQSTVYLAEGVRVHEHLMFVADDPKPAEWTTDLIASGQLVVASTSEVYGTARIVDAEAQRDMFEGELANALHDGYTGIRVAADNTSLIAAPDGLYAWMVWESVGDEFMAHHPVSGLCAFDRSRIDNHTLQKLLDAHHTTVSVSASGD